MSPWVLAVAGLVVAGASLLIGVLAARRIVDAAYRFPDPKEPRP